MICMAYYDTATAIILSLPNIVCHDFDLFPFVCLLFMILQFSMRTRTPSVNGSIYSPFSSTRKVGLTLFNALLCSINLNNIIFLF